MPDKTLNEVFTDIANAIREKTESQETMTPLEMADEIANISTGPSEDGFYQISDGEVTPLSDPCFISEGGALQVYGYDSQLGYEGFYSYVASSAGQITFDPHLTLGAGIVYASDSDGWYLSDSIHLTFDSVYTFTDGDDFPEFEALENGIYRVYYGCAALELSTDSIYWYDDVSERLSPINLVSGSVYVYDGASSFNGQSLVTNSAYIYIGSSGFNDCDSKFVIGCHIDDYGYNVWGDLEEGIYNISSSLRYGYEKLELNSGSAYIYDDGSVFTPVELPSFQAQSCYYCDANGEIQEGADDTAYFPCSSVRWGSRQVNEESVYKYTWDNGLEPYEAPTLENGLWVANDGEVEAANTDATYMYVGESWYGEVTPDWLYLSPGSGIMLLPSSTGLLYFEQGLTTGLDGEYTVLNEGGTYTYNGGSSFTPVEASSGDSISEPGVYALDPNYNSGELTQLEEGVYVVHGENFPEGCHDFPENWDPEWNCDAVFTPISGTYFIGGGAGNEENGLIRLKSGLYSITQEYNGGSEAVPQQIKLSDDAIYLSNGVWYYAGSDYDGSLKLYSRQFNYDSVYIYQGDDNLVSLGSVNENGLYCYQEESLLSIGSVSDGEIYIVDPSYGDNMLRTVCANSMYLASYNGEENIVLDSTTVECGSLAYVYAIGSDDRYDGLGVLSVDDLNLSDLTEDNPTITTTTYLYLTTPDNPNNYNGNKHVRITIELLSD